MSATFTVFTFGTTPLFGARTFLPAFLILLWIYSSVPSAVANESTVGEGMLLLFLILAVLELLADKNVDLHFMYNQVNVYFKPVVFLYSDYYLLDVGGYVYLEYTYYLTSNELWHDAGAYAKLVSQESVGVFNYFIMIVGAGMVYGLSKFRNNLLLMFSEIDEEDDLGIRKAISWLEDGGVLVGFWLLLAFGIIAVGIFFTTLFVLFLLKKYYEKQLEKQKVTCDNCQTLNLPFALNCFNCGKPQQHVHKIGWLGQRKKDFVYHFEEHATQLLTHRRCSNCATKLPERTTNQHCTACSQPAFVTPDIWEYTEFVDRKYNKILGYSIALGFMPILGIILTVIITNVNLSTPYRRYLPAGKRFGLRIMTRLLTALIIFFGAFTGPVAGPIYVTVKHRLSKRAFMKHNSIRKGVRSL